jgi:IS30 family transposase
MNKQNHLRKDERFCIEKLLRTGATYKDIAVVLERGESTIGHEVRRNGGRTEYSAAKAHQRACLRQYRKKRMCLKVAMDIGIRKQVEHYLYTYRWSPETISAALQYKHRLFVSAKAIYKYIYKRCLEYLLPQYRKRRKGYPRHNLTDRIFVDDVRCVREGYGHWEGDFIVCPQNTSVLLVLTERLSKETRIRYLQNRNNDLVNQAVVSMLSDRTVQSITLDNDIAFNKHKILSSLLAAPVYFTRPYRSTDKALVENTNRWIRQFVPKRTNLATVNPIQIKKALHWLNERPRECLGWMTTELCARQQEVLLKFS